MSDESERDLRAAFEELSAPASTSNYAWRTSGIDIPSTRSHWPQAVASALAVAVALAGAGTFLALRSARQGGVASSGATGSPPARSGAAMVWDSTAGVTVMFGGSGGSGNTLNDVWTWDGSRWTAAAKGPGALNDVRMVDDPADGGVLLLGVPAPPISNGGGVSGCATGGSGNAVGSSGSGIATPAAKGMPAVAIATAPANVSTPGSSPPGSAALPTCAPAVVAPGEQTWLFTQHGWSHQAARATAPMAPAGSQLTYDPSTRQVVAVSTGYTSCGLPLGAASAVAPAIICPMLGAPSALARPIQQCLAGSTCTSGATLTTWTWSGTAWRAEPATAVQAGVITLLFLDPTTQHATLMTSTGELNTCPASFPTCPGPASVAMTSTWSWTGTAWHLVSQEFIGQATPSLQGASVTPVSGHIVVLTATGETWTFAAGQWTQDTVAGHPSIRSGAAMAEGPSSTVVLFGGSAGAYSYPLALGAEPAGSRATLGSDTWVWNGTSWRHAAGSPPTRPPPVGCPETASGSIPPCAPMPGTMAPSSPLSSPVPNLHIVPQGLATPTP